MPSALRKIFISAPRAARQNLSGRKIIVTGTAPNSIGFETARTLAEWGATVIVATRSQPQAAASALRQRLPDHCQHLIDCHALDLAQAASVQQFADWYTAKHGTLDVLVNNAGVHLDLLSQWKEPQLSADGHEIQWRINYLGTLHLTHLLLPLLRSAGRASGDARIVNVVSQLHTRGSNAGLFVPQQPYNSWTAYARSKLALVHATLELQRREAGAHLQAYCLHPGAVFTNVAGKGLSGNPAIEKVRGVMAPIEAFFLLTPEEGAQTSVHCATSPGLAGGLYYNKCAVTKASAETQASQVSERLWSQTEAWVKSLG